MNQIIDCKGIAQEILDEVKSSPHKKVLMTISVGEDKSFESYLRGIKKDCEYCGIEVLPVSLEEKDEVGFFHTIARCNRDYKIGGVIVHNNLPYEFHYDAIRNIAPEKDIDNITDTSRYENCTAEAVMEILKHEPKVLTDIDKNILVVGRGRIGRAVTRSLLNKGCSVMSVRGRSEDLEEYANLNLTDVIISAVGKPIINGRWGWQRTIIDCGTSFDSNGKIRGDLYNIDKMSDCRYTTVPNGVGLVTRAVLLRHLVKN